MQFSISCSCWILNSFFGGIEKTDLPSFSLTLRPNWVSVMTRLSPPIECIPSQSEAQKKKILKNFEFLSFVFFTAYSTLLQNLYSSFYTINWDGNQSFQRSILWIKRSQNTDSPKLLVSRNANWVSVMTSLSTPIECIVCRPGHQETFLRGWGKNLS